MKKITLSILISLLGVFSLYSHQNQKEPKEYKIAIEKKLDLINFQGDEKTLSIFCKNKNINRTIREKVGEGSVFCLSRPFAGNVLNTTSVDVMLYLQDNPWMPSFSFLLPQNIDSLKTKGMGLICAFPKESFHYQLFLDLFETQKWQPYKKNFMLNHSFSILEYQQFCKMNGFKILYKDMERSFLEYHSRKELEKDLEKNLPYLIELPPKLEKEFLHDLINAAIEKNMGSENIYIPYETVTFLFQK